MKLGQQIVRVNDQNLAGATYSEVLAALRKTEEHYTIELMIFDSFNESKKINNNVCCIL